jgi:hypothetical protein
VIELVSDVWEYRESVLVCQERRLHCMLRAGGGLRCMWMARDDIVRLEREEGGSHIWDERQRFERKRAKITLPCRLSISGS